LVSILRPRLAVLAAGTGFAFDQPRVDLLTGLVLDGHPQPPPALIQTQVFLPGM